MCVVAIQSTARHSGADFWKRQNCYHCKELKQTGRKILMKINRFDEGPKEKLQSSIVYTKKPRISLLVLMHVSTLPRRLNCTFCAYKINCYSDLSNCKWNLVFWNGTRTVSPPTLTFLSFSAKWRLFGTRIVSPPPALPSCPVITAGESGLNYSANTK